MNMDQASHDRNREALIDALLRAALVDEQAAVAIRVDRVMHQIELEKCAPCRATDERNHGARSNWSRWVSLAIAASLLGAAFIGFQYLGPAQSALAAIEQSLEAAEERVARKYLITVTRKDGKVSREIENDLYVEGNDRFALRHPTLLPGVDLWLGKNGDTNWAVPVIGPVLTGNDLALSRWLSVQEQLSTPYLHITTVLDRMSRGYRLRQLSESTIRCGTGKDVLCRHVLGEIKREANQNLPATIELWSDAESGVAIRIEARWSLSASDSGREKVIIEFAEQPDLPDNWFEAEGHYSGSRSKITFDIKENQ